MRFCEHLQNLRSAIINIFNEDIILDDDFLLHGTNRFSKSENLIINLVTVCFIYYVKIGQSRRYLSEFENFIPFLRNFFNESFFNNQYLRKKARDMLKQAYQASLIEL